MVLYVQVGPADPDVRDIDADLAGRGCARVAFLDSEGVVTDIRGSAHQALRASVVTP
jgi:hypothetical protein